MMFTELVKMSHILRTSLTLLVLLVALFSLTGCSGEYYAGKEYWHAGQIAGKVFRNPFLASSALYDEALEGFQKIVRRYPDSPSAGKARLMIGRLRILRRDFEGARSSLSEVIEGYSDLPDLAAEAQFAIGQSYELEERWPEAVDAYRNTFLNFPASSKVLRVPMFVAKSIHKRDGTPSARGAYEQALADYDFIIQETSEKETAAVALGFKARCLLTLGAPENALRVYQQILDEHPESWTVSPVMLEMANLHQHWLNQPEKAVEIYETLYARQNEGGPVYRSLPLLLGNLYVQASRMEEARALFDEVLKKYSKDSELSAFAHVGLGVSYEREGYWDEAMTHYEILMRDYPDTLQALQVYLRVANHYQQLGELQKAEEVHQEALATYKEIIKGDWSKDLVASAQDFMSLSYAIREDWPAVVRNLNTIVADYPNSHRALTSYLTLAAVYKEKLHEKDKAILTYKRILSNYPDHHLARVAEAQLQQLVTGK